MTLNKTMKVSTFSDHCIHSLSRSATSNFPDMMTLKLNIEELVVNIPQRVEMGSDYTHRMAQFLDTALEEQVCNLSRSSSHKFPGDSCEQWGKVVALVVTGLREICVGDGGIMRFLPETTSEDVCTRFYCFVLDNVHRMRMLHLAWVSSWPGCLMTAQIQAARAAVEQGTLVSLRIDGDVVSGRVLMHNILNVVVNCQHLVELQLRKMYYSAEVVNKIKCLTNLTTLCIRYAKPQILRALICTRTSPKLNLTSLGCFSRDILELYRNPCHTECVMRLQWYGYNSLHLDSPEDLSANLLCALGVDPDQLSKIREEVMVSHDRRGVRCALRGGFGRGIKALYMTISVAPYFITGVRYHSAQVSSGHLTDEEVELVVRVAGGVDEVVVDSSVTVAQRDHLLEVTTNVEVHHPGYYRTSM